MTLREIVPYLRRWLITSLLCVFCFPAIAQQSLMEGPALNDLFSKTQAKHGSKIFASQCVHCHSDKKVRRFLFDRWSGKSLGGFYEHLRKTMPPENTGKLQPEDYLNVTAFLVVKQGFNTSDSDSDGEHEQWRKAIVSSALGHSKDEKEEKKSDISWHAYKGNVYAQGYSSADQINRENVGELQVAWRWSGRNFGPSPELKNISTPLMIDGVLYFTAGLTRNVVAVNAASGETLWMWRPKEKSRFEDAPRKGAGRGVAYWGGGGANNGRIFVVTPGFQLLALDAATGRPEVDFGEGGRVDLREGLRLAPGRRLEIGSSSPPFVMGDVVVVGPALASGMRAKSKRNVKGDVRAYSASTGEHLWTFHTIPETAAAHDDANWQGNSRAYTGNVGVWAPMSGDPDLGLLYLPVESPTNDYYGGKRLGHNRYANSLVCLDINTGKMKWHFQTSHHDIWDWDLPTAPILIDLPKPGGTIKAVAQITKQGFVYVFNREHGEPLWPINEIPVPQSDVPGEQAALTQPIPSLPKPFDRQGIGIEDLIDFTPELHEAASSIIAPYRLGAMYAPPSLANAADGTQGTLTLPSSIGGANWEGGVVDPESGLIYIGSMTLPTVLALEQSPQGSDSGYVGVISMPTIDGLPIVKPPWGRITAIDLNSGEHAWMVANGDPPVSLRSHPKLKGVDIGRTGKQTRSGLLLTKTLLFAGEGFMGSAVLRAHDKASGQVLAEIPLPATQIGLPMTYLWQGKQYIAMMIGDGEKPAELVALSLP